MKDKLIWLRYHRYCYRNYLNVSDVKNFMKFMEVKLYV